MVKTLSANSSDDGTHALHGLDQSLYIYSGVISSCCSSRGANALERSSRNGSFEENARKKNCRERAMDQLRALNDQQFGLTHLQLHPEVLMLMLELARSTCRRTEDLGERK